VKTEPSFFLIKRRKIYVKSHNEIAIFIKKCKNHHILKKFYTYKKNILYLCTEILRKSQTK